MKLRGSSGKRERNGSSDIQKTVKEIKAQDAEKATATTKSKKTGGRLSAKAKICIVAGACLVVALLAAGAAGGVIYVRNYQGFFPNFTIDGVDVGGLDYSGAMDALRAHGYDSIGGKTLSVHLPLDNSLEMPAEDFCTETELGLIVQAAYDVCHGKSDVGNAVTYLRSRMGGLDYESGYALNVDETAVAAAVDSIARKVKLELMNGSLVIGEDSILITKGADSVEIDAEGLTAMICDAFRSGDYSDIVYEATASSEDEIDLEGVRETVYRDCADAYYDPETDEVVPETVGLDFDVASAARLWDSADYGQVIEIPLIITEPELGYEELSELLFRDSLASMSTTLRGSSSNRVNNVTKACESINGMVIMPGEEFSYNPALGERTAERGYLPAGAYANGENVTEYGGGICQVSSTLYYCALYANLKITNRVCHMFPVSYLPPGLDATVSWGGPDFKFVNNRDYPIKIVAGVENNSANVELLGTDVDGSYVQMNYSTWAVYDEEYTDVQVGYGARTYRSVFDADGNLLSRKEEASSYYAFHDEDIEWPEESPEVSETPEPTPSAPPAETPEPTPTETPEETPGQTPPPETQEPVETPEPTPEPPPEATDPVGE